MSPPARIFGRRPRPLRDRPKTLMSSASHRLRRRPRFARQRRNAGLLTVIPHLTRRAPAAAPAPRPPCLTGRCHCRTWGIAHTMDTHWGIRRLRWPPSGAAITYDIGHLRPPRDADRRAARSPADNLLERSLSLSGKHVRGFPKSPRCLSPARGRPGVPRGSAAIGGCPKHHGAEVAARCASGALTRS